MAVFELTKLHLRHNKLTYGAANKEKHRRFSSVVEVEKNIEGSLL